MFKITHGLLEFPMAPAFAYPTRQGLRGHVFTIRAVPFWSKRPAEIVNASSVKSFKALLDAHWQSPEVPI